MGVAVVVLFLYTERRARDRVARWRRVQQAFGMEAVGGEPYRDSHKGLSCSYRDHHIHLFEERGPEVGPDPVVVRITGPRIDPAQQLSLGLDPSEETLTSAVHDARRLIDDAHDAHPGD